MGTQLDLKALQVISPEFFFLLINMPSSPCCMFLSLFLSSCKSWRIEFKQSWVGSLSNSFSHLVPCAHGAADDLCGNKNYCILIAIRKIVCYFVWCA